MGRFWVFAVLVCMLAAGLRPAHAQSVSLHQDKIFFKMGDQDYIVCSDGTLDEGGYAALLTAYMRYTVENGLVARYLKIYGDQNMKSGGRMNDIVAEQKIMTTPEQLAVLYTPYQDTLSLDDFFKIHVLHATNIMAVMTQKLGPGPVRTLCRTKGSTDEK